MEQKEQQRQEFENLSFEIVDRLFKEYDGQLDTMSAKEQEIVLIWRLEADMYNGGFIQYFCNWGYKNFENTQKVLEQLGAEKTLQIITECEKIISVLKDDNRIKELWDIPKYLQEYLTEEQDARLNELDELYWENPDDLQLLCYHFYLKNDTE